MVLGLTSIRVCLLLYFVYKLNILSFHLKVEEILANLCKDRVEDTTQIFVQLGYVNHTAVYLWLQVAAIKI